MQYLPSKKELMGAILSVMNSSGEILTTSTINEKVAKLLDIPPALLEVEDSNCTGTEYSYRMRWARTELKEKGYIKNVRRGEWAICK